MARVRGTHSRNVTFELFVRFPLKMAIVLIMASGISVISMILQLLASDALSALKHSAGHHCLAISAHIVFDIIDYVTSIVSSILNRNKLIPFTFTGIHIHIPIPARTYKYIRYKPLQIVSGTLNPRRSLTAHFTYIHITRIPPRSVNHHSRRIAATRPPRETPSLQITPLNRTDVAGGNGP